MSAPRRLDAGRPDVHAAAAEAESTGERYADTLRRAPVFVTHQDLDLRYVWAPLGIPGHGDASSAELLGRSDDELLPAGAAVQVSALKRSVLAAGRRRRAQLVIGAAHYDCTLDPIRGAGGGIEALACVAFDITEHKRVEADLRRSRALLAEAEHLARIGSWEWDIAQNRVSWSSGLYEIYGIDPARFDHRYEPGSQRVHPDDRARVDATVQRALETGNAIDIEYRIVRTDGRIRRIHGRAEVVFDDHGKPRRLTGTAQDVTELRAAEDALEHTAAELARRAAELHDVARGGGGPPPKDVERLLSQRQLEILRLIADGYSNAEIAARLFVTEGTVKWHVRRILSALGVANRAQAVARLLAGHR
jgi:PAS domain S-box-containing protein